MKRRQSFFGKDFDLKQTNTKLFQRNASVQKAVALHLKSRLERQETLSSKNDPKSLLTAQKPGEEAAFSDYGTLVQRVYEHIGDVEEKRLDNVVLNVESLFEKDPYSFDQFAIGALIDKLRKKRMDSLSNLSSEDFDK